MRVALGERAPLLLEGTEIRPKACWTRVFVFCYGTVDDALVELCER